MPTVDDLRNEIRVAVDRFEREIAADFTKEDLAAVFEALGRSDDGDLLGDGRLPPKGEMRAGILAAVGEGDGERAAEVDERVEQSFRKAELEAIREALADEHGV